MNNNINILYCSENQDYQVYVLEYQKLFKE